MRNHNLNTSGVDYSKRLLERNYKHCQRCRNTFSSMLNYGTNADGTINYAFCKNCYKDGAFTNKELQLSEVINDSSVNKGWLQKISIKNIYKK